MSRSDVSPGGMNGRSLLRAVVCAGLLIAGPAACATGSSPSSVPAASVRPSSVSPSGSAVVSPTAVSPSSAQPSASSGACSSPAACATPASATCPIPTVDLTLGSDRMVAVEVAPGETVDVVRFSFGPPETTAQPAVTVEPREPPFVTDPAGLPLDVVGAHVAVVRMGIGMWLYDAAGIPTYRDPSRFDEPGPGIRSVVRAGAFEGYETWLIGFDAGCLSAALAPDGSLEVRVAR